ncbi:phosphopantothenoylcysteine synthetase/decarboxylase [Kitasatospora sp. MAA19]|uniref:flavoprotein n=1 Tax=Kitasatospora sp. MAA19 TaxID=3035090 RepID=UPI002475A0AB|nr:flavoprotein [Kitasatospora sp. MAA19]MDH6709271.1 phosphopantothenoylcysteine synthetase/decarboxylase [Kitasatospora sp. MAA19]
MRGDGKPVLCVVVCAAGVAGGVGELIAAAQEKGWEVGVVATPPAMGFIDEEGIVARTGYPVRSAWRRPGDPRPLPEPDAIVVAPATFNTINKWAAGISDTLALGILCESYGWGVPVAVQPCLSAAQAVHPAYGESLATLRGMGVRIAEFVPGAYRWTRVLELLED